MWRQNAKMNLYSESDSSETSEFDDSDTDSSSSCDKKPVNKRPLPNNKGLRPGRPPIKPKDSKLHGTSSNSSISRRDGPLNSRPPSGKSIGANASRNRNNNSNNNNNSSNTRNFSSSSTSSLLSKRRENNKTTTTTTTSNRRIGHSTIRPQNLHAKENNSWTGNGIRKKLPIDIGLKPDRRPPQSPGSHAQKPRSSSVNEAAPEKLQSSPGAAGYRSIVNRVRSAKPPPRVVYQHKTPPKHKPNLDSKIFTISNSSSSDDDDEVERDDDESSSSDDSR